MPLVAWDIISILSAVRCWTGSNPRAAVLNPAPLLRWNSDKRYLAELGRKGIAVIPTRIAERLDEAALAEARSEFGAELVIKPPVSASADGTTGSSRTTAAR
jgi:hypothetical protein